jgi:RNA polymerase sigma factor (sigma-70 family)
MDAPLVRAARGGSQAAFSRLVATHEKPLRGFLRKSGWIDADDIAQDAFVAAWTSLGRLRADDGFRAWLYGIAWRKALDHRRAASRSARRDEEWRGQEVQEAPSQVAGEDRMALQAALETLARRPKGLRHPLPGPGLVPRRGRRGSEYAAGDCEVACDARS